MISQRTVSIAAVVAALMSPALLAAQKPQQADAPAQDDAAQLVGPAFRPDNVELAFPQPTHPALAPAAGLGVFGDVNADETVNILDAQQIARHSAALPVADPDRMASNGDVDADGGVNVIDAQLVARYAIDLDVEARVGELVSGAIALFPWDLGRRWYYDIEWTSTVISGTGGSTSNADGPVLMYGTDMFPWQGRDAWRVWVWEWLTLDDASMQFRWRERILSSVNGTLEQWSNSDAAWRKILDPNNASFSNNAFMLAGGPDFTAPTEQTVTSVTVPYGTFDALRADYHYDNYDPLLPEPPVDYREDRTEWYAPGIGLVYVFWDDWEDDNSGGCCDLYFDGTYSLRYLDEGPIPAVGTEGSGETNDAPSTADAIPLPSVVIGFTAITDVGTVVDDVNVSANKNGEKLIQDWWAFTHSGSGSLRIELKGLGPTNDLDLYVFSIDDTGAIAHVASSKNPAGADERLTGTLPAGTYVLAVQAWDTPDLNSNGDVIYFLSLR